MTSDLFYVDYEPIVYDNGRPRYAAYLLDEGDNVIDSVVMTLDVGAATFFEFGIQDGLNIKPVFVRPAIPTNVSIFDKVERISGSYPESLLVPVAMPTNWAYRGNDYELHWYKAYGSDSVNSVIVIDVHSGDTIPFKAFDESDTLYAPFADGWCFQSLNIFTDTLVYGSVPMGTRNLYICGGKFAIASGWLDTEPRPSDGEEWFVYAKEAYLPAPANARVQITPTPPSFDTLQIALNVKVTPNPYIIHNEWQTTLRQRRLKFINLPNQCTIRIYNLNGELVKTLIHRETLSPEEGEQEILNSAGGDEWWDLLSENRQLVASGMYIFHIDSDVGEQVGKFVVIR
jgi:hypothetical protein